MTAEVLAMIVALVVPVVSFITVGGLVAGLKALDRSRDELNELRLGK